MSSRRSPDYRSHRDRDRDRRRSPSPRRRHSPGPSRRDRDRRDSPPPRKEGDLPSSFSREHLQERKDDRRNVLERMDKGCDSSAMRMLVRCVKEKLKVKVWTRNHREVRGICTGYITFFDKHWNLVMKDVDEVYLKPKKGKTPYLKELGPGDSEKIPEAQPKKPKEKKKVVEGEDTPAPTPAKPAEGGGDAGEKKKKKKKKKKKSKMERRCVANLFLRGDNIVMIASCVEDDEVEEEEEETEMQTEEKVSLPE